MEAVSLRAGRVFSTDEWAVFEEAFLIFRAAANKLSALAISKGQLRWRQRPKAHGLEHLCYDYHKLNPRFCSNYLCEDFVRRTKNVAVKSHPRYVSKHVLFRYCIAACLRWTAMSPVWKKTDRNNEVWKVVGQIWHMWHQKRKCR